MTGYCIGYRITLDSAEFAGGMNMELAMIVGGLVLAVTIITGIVTYLVNKLN